jgi:hypothetical protein
VVCCEVLERWLFEVRTYNYLANSDADFVRGNAVEVTEKNGLDSIRSNLTKLGLQFKRKLQYMSKIDSEITCCVEHTTWCVDKIRKLSSDSREFFIESNIVSLLLLLLYYYYIIIIITSVPRVLSFMKSHRSEAYSHWHGLQISRCFWNHWSLSRKISVQSTFSAPVFRPIC